MNTRETLQDVIYDSLYCIIEKYYNFKNLSLTRRDSTRERDSGIFKKQSIINLVVNDNNIIQNISSIFRELNQNFKEEKIQLISNNFIK